MNAVRKPMDYPHTSTQFATAAPKPEALVNGFASAEQEKLAMYVLQKSYSAHHELAK